MRFGVSCRLWLVFCFSCTLFGGWELRLLRGVFMGFVWSFVLFVGCLCCLLDCVVLPDFLVCVGLWLWYFA